MSGGALIPYRFAHELKNRGHESYVFSGRLADLAPGQIRDEVIEGVPVRWVGNSSFLAWNDEKNFNNPKLAERFEDYLRDVNPDVVHFHSIQTLGAQMLDIAKALGYPVVVTMHDFWWACARQFLVDDSDTPCSPVVSSGNCQCAAGRSALLERQRWLARRLRSADLILFPSESARQVLIANGVDPKKTAVNENGIEGALDVARKPEVRDGVRFMYTGGDATMKGFEVLREAAQLARVPRGTSLSLFNTPDAAFPNWAVSQPRYERVELSDVFARHDVLILPSLMRESHSIVTREALKAGLAVIATDSVGPEEAMSHGVNGLVVKSGDATELARAIEHMADPAVAARMMGRGSASEIVSVEAQIDDIESHYQKVISTNLDDAPGDLDKTDDIGEATLADGVYSFLRRVVYVIGIQGAPARYRAHLPAEALKLRGIQTTILHYNDPSLGEQALQADAVVFYRVPATKRVLEIIESIRSAPQIIPILGDVDDLIFDPSIADSLDNLGRLDDEERALWIRGLHRYRTTLEACDYFIGSTQLVTSEGERLLGVPATRFDNGVGVLLAQASERAMAKPRRDGPIRIGFFSGTNTHDADWASIEPAIARVLDAHDVQVWLGGLVEPTELLDPYRQRIKRFDFVTWSELPQLLHQVDICLAPLTPDSRFNEAKSAIKWLEAALVETPTIASPTQPFREVIRQGETGMIAGDEDEWVEAITQLLGEPQLRRHIGREAKRQALIERSADRQGWTMVEILTDAWLHVARNGHKAPSAWPAVMDEEPADPTAGVESYDVTVRTAPRMIGRASTALKKTQHSLQTVGLSATAKKIVHRVIGK